MMKLVENWKDAWKWFSVHCLVLVALIPTVWLELPPEAKEAIPASWMSTITLVVGICGIIGRFIKQSPPKQE